MRKAFQTIIISLCMLFAAAGAVKTEAAGVRNVTLAATGDAVQDADNLQEALDGGNVKLTLTGDFVISGSKLNLSSNTTVDATRATVTQTTPGIGIFKNLGGTGGYGSLTGITITGGEWIGQYTSADKGYSTMFFQHASNIVIENAKFTNNYNGHHVEFSGVQNAVVRNCTFGGTYQGENEKEAIQLETCNEKLAPDYVSPMDNTANDGITVENCTIDYPIGVGDHKTVEGYWNRNLTVKNCTIKAKHKGIGAYNVVGLELTGNTITGGETGIDVRTLSTVRSATDYVGYKASLNLVTDYGVHITGNRISGTTLYGIRLLGASSRQIKNADVENNTVSTVGNSGIYASYAPNMTLAGNTVTSSSGTGMTVRNSSTAVVKNNKIRKIATHGMLFFASPYTKITENTVTDVSKNNGITVRDGSNGVTLTKNTVKRVAAIGFSVISSSKVAFTDNTVTNCGKQCVIATSASDFTLSGNTISTAATNAVTIQTSSKNAVVSKNKIKNAKKNGISMISSANIRITGNTISGCKKMAISINNGKATITRNKITTGGKKSVYAVYLQKAKGCTVKNNTVSGVCYAAVGYAANVKVNLKEPLGVTVNSLKKGTRYLKGTVKAKKASLTVTVNGKRVKAKKDGSGWTTEKQVKLKSKAKVAVKVKDKYKNTHTVTVTVK